MTGGLGGIAMASMLDPGVLRAAEKGESRSRGIINPFHHKPRAKRIIWLYQAGGPSHLETLDWKPKLREMNGKPMPESYTKGQPIAQLQGRPLTCMEPQHPFGRHGQSGQAICSLFPRIGKIADELCIIRSLKTEAINHDPAHTFMNTGTTISGKPAMGSWLQYGLGSEAADLPGFVVMVSTGKGGQMQPIASRQWHSGFLPSRFQGVRFESKREPVYYLSSPPGVTEVHQRDVIDAVRALNRMRNTAVDDPEIATRIEQYEMAFKMQTSVPRLMDISDESKETLDLYGVGNIDGSFSSNCLLARRLAERGVRFIQLYHRDWDHHGNLRRDMKVLAEEVDRASAALIVDLKRRGLLEDTIVVWGGEFGRTPMAQGNGRDHHIKGFSMWVAGGGFKGGMSYGATDELGYNAVENVVHVHDLHATMLHLLGVEHTRLTYKFQGRDYRLTDVHGEVVKKIIAG
jgi:hypothetical protein